MQLKNTKLSGIKVAFGAWVCPLLQPVGRVSVLGYTVEAAPDMEKPQPQPGAVSWCVLYLSMRCLARELIGVKTHVGQQKVYRGHIQALS